MLHALYISSYILAIFLSLANDQFAILVSRVSSTLKGRHNAVVTSHVNNTTFLLASTSRFSLVTSTRAVGLINYVTVAVRTTTGTMRVVTAIQDGYKRDGVLR
jgi:hypothetical protein